MFLNFFVYKNWQKLTNFYSKKQIRKNKIIFQEQIEKKTQKKFKNLLKNHLDPRYS